MKLRDQDYPGERSAAASNPRHAQCEHAFIELYVQEKPGRGRKPIIAICSDCAAVATRMWPTPFGDHLGWIFPNEEEAFRAWHRRLRAHGWRS